MRERGESYSFLLSRIGFVVALILRDVESVIQSASLASSSFVCVCVWREKREAAKCEMVEMAGAGAERERERGERVTLEDFFKGSFESTRSRRPHTPRTITSPGEGGANRNQASLPLRPIRKLEADSDGVMSPTLDQSKQTLSIGRVEPLLSIASSDLVTPLFSFSCKYSFFFILENI